ncbi:unnamed protein product [Nezara viridula]|uniref:Uncharacterized protein n=1 Tax=Nezara viridula TaxID=85310 RepID=A0A9P0HJY9_NEZVI|nr:unnamed protein product [Nezara viridula]
MSNSKPNIKQTECNRITQINIYIYLFIFYFDHNNKNMIFTLQSWRCEISSDRLEGKSSKSNVSYKRSHQNNGNKGPIRSPLTY